MGISNHFLEVLYRPAESGRGKTITMYTIPIILTEGCKKYRGSIWKELILLSEEAYWEKILEIFWRNMLRAGMMK